jgi:(E)-4-hydroxy-3-methylbut-2-enyl-diphosphate synthase
MPDLSKYTIPLSREITIGNVKMGGSLPLVVQTMTSTDTNDIDASVQQCMRIIEEEGEMIRLTTQGKKEVQSIEEIITELDPLTKCVPIIADVHFSAAVAEYAAEVCHKIRINPGNYTEKRGDEKDYSEGDFQAGDQLNQKALRSLLTICKNHSTALRIGVNHGSLSNRIMSKYGDTPEGMVESAMEFMRVCSEEDYHNVVVSLKSSNTRVMVQSVRLLTREMIKEDLYYPIHLGVTEAGDGLEGRVKSVVGMAPLLLEGIGNTIRVSLTEPPEDEIPVARNIRSLFPRPQELPYNPFGNFPWDPFHYGKPLTKKVLGVGGGLVPVVWGDATLDEYPSEFSSSYLFTDLSSDPGAFRDSGKDSVVVLDINNQSIAQAKLWFTSYYSMPGVNPVVVRKSYDEKEPERFALQASGELGTLLIDGLIDGIWIENPHLEQSFITEISFMLLQASRARITSTEFIACPSCGRTLFDIQSVLGEVRSATSHLTGLKIAVMGCIVNGPGEMADADYGYVGAGKGKISLYRAGKLERKNIPAESAVESLVELIKSHGDWFSA